jgi:hypothetical protein
VSGSDSSAMCTHIGLSVAHVFHINEYQQGKVKQVQANQCQITHIFIHSNASGPL